VATEIKIIKDFSLTIDLSKAFHRLGDKRPYHRIDGSLKRSLAEGREKLFSLLRPAAIYRILDYEETNRHPVFAEARKVALAVSTVGLEAEKEIGRLFRKDEILKALILDALASEAVKEVVWETERVIVGEALVLGLWPSKRFSPGYKGWDLEEQRFVFNKIPAGKIGVTLTESCMMIPRKSLSLRINFYSERSLTTRRLHVEKRKVQS
jgi:hypothetical protein